MDVHTFAGSPLDRAAHLRRDTDWQAAALRAPTTRMVPFWRLKPLIREGDAPRIAWLGADDLTDILDAEAAHIFLGVDESGAARYAVDVPGLSEDSPPLTQSGTFIDLRAIAPALPEGAPAILAQARSLIAWHARTAFCGACGAPTRTDEAGHLRRCTDASCDAQYFPRVDPVVIMLVYRGERCLLGRSTRFPAGFYSALAGFVEPGEAIEESVRREVLEEAGITVGAVCYHSSQPWPFPASLMIGCLAEAESDAITIDAHELDDVRWVSRDELMAALDGAPGADFSVPPPLAIARQLMTAWAKETG